MARVPMLRRVAQAVGAVFKGAIAPVSWKTVWGAVREAAPGYWQRNIVVDGHDCILAFSAVYACVTRIANDIAKLRIKLVELDENGIWREVARNSPHAQVLKKPNRYQNRIQFLTDWLVMKLLYGNTYVLKERDERGIVIALYVLDSRRVRPVVYQDGSIYYQISSDALAGQPSGGLVRDSEIIHDRCPTLWHPLHGVSPIYACASSATQGNRIQANSAQFFENMSRPGGVLVVPGQISDPEFERMKAEWNENFAGAKAGRTAVLTNGTKYDPISMPAQDAQLIEQLKWTVEDVARAFAMPLYKIGAGPVPTSGNVSTLNKQYYDECLQVHIEAIELCLDEGLGLTTAATPFPIGAELDLDGLLRMDGAALVSMLGEGVKNALVTPNEGRLRMNLPPLDGGAVAYLQQQNYSLAALAKRDSSDDPFGTAKPEPAPGPPMPALPAPPVDDEAGKAVQQLLLRAMEVVRDCSERVAAIEAKAQMVPVALEAEEPDVEQLAAALLRGFADLELTYA